MVFTVCYSDKNSGVTGKMLVEINVQNFRVFSVPIT